MVTYRVDGKILTLVVSGDLTDTERRAFYDAVRNDPKVPEGASLLIDARDAAITFRDAVFEDRIRTLITELGRKFSGACAIIESKADVLYGVRFQHVGERLNARIGLFPDEESARTWLSAYADGKAC